MNVNVEPRATGRMASRLAIADCDIHPVRRTPNDFDPWLPARWREQFEPPAGTYLYVASSATSTLPPAAHARARR